MYAIRSYYAEYYLQPGDVLYVSIHSTLSETEGMFHFPGQESVASGGSQSGQMYLNQSVIDDEGYIRMPVLGKIYVAGSTVEQIEKVVEARITSYNVCYTKLLRFPLVDRSLVSPIFRKGSSLPRT